MQKIPCAFLMLLGNKLSDLYMSSHKTWNNGKNLK